MRFSVMAGMGWALLALAGCTSISEQTGSFWVQPGKYDFLKCPDIAQRTVGVSNREKELLGLMERADRDAAGPVVNAMVYSADLKQTRADLDLLRRTAREKGCNNPTPAPQASNPAPPPQASPRR